jgi:hypothetical protein
LSKRRPKTAQLLRSLGLFHPQLMPKVRQNVSRILRPPSRYRVEFSRGIGYRPSHRSSSSFFILVPAAARPS